MKVEVNDDKYKGLPAWMIEDRKREEYYGRLDSWLFDSFLNTSSAPRNDHLWFNEKIRQALDEVRGNKPLIIGMCGVAGSGKDSAIEYLLSEPKLFVQRMAFADPLKKIAKIFGFTQEQLTKRDLKEAPDAFWGISPRKFLQMCGTEMFRNVWRQDVWTELAKKRIAELSKPIEVDIRFGGPPVMGTNRIIFVTDVRFHNEAKLIHDLGGIVVRVDRVNNANAIDNKHASEKDINNIPVDLVVENVAASSEEWSWLFAKRLVIHFKHNAFFY